MKIKTMTLFALLTVVSLGAAEPQNMPTELYQEIVANADTLADSVAVFSKLSQTSKALKQQLDAALPVIVAQLARKYGVDTDVARIYFGIEQAKKLNPALFKNTEELSKLLEEIAAIEKNPKVLHKMVTGLTKAGAYFTRYQTRLINGDNWMVSFDGLYKLNSEEDSKNLPTITGYSNSELFAFVKALLPFAQILDVNLFKANGSQFFRFLIHHAGKNYLIVDTDTNFNVLSSRNVSLPQSIDDQMSLIALVTSRDGAHSSIIFQDTKTINIVSLDGQIGTITAEIKQDKNNYKISKFPWEK